MAGAAEPLLWKLAPIQSPVYNTSTRGFVTTEVFYLCLMR